jgi:CRISPR type IV-associated protein Csf2
MTTRIFEGVMTALSSISHNGGQSFGINSKLRREKFVQPDGSVEEIPVISGNGLRGLLRDRGMLHMCRALGYGVSDADGSVTGLSLGAFYFLFSGGSLSSGGGKAIDIDQAREIRNLIPLVGVFGGALGNMILPGKIKVGKAIPICAETSHLLPESFRRENVPSIWDYLQEEMYTRKDDEKNEHLRAVISPRVRGLLDGARAEKAQRPANEPQDDTGQHQQMMYYVETFAAGTPFYWKVCLDDATDLEFEALLTTLVEWSRLPYIGGKSGTGMGEVAVKFDRWLEVDSRATVEGREVAAPAGSIYARHLADHGADIRTFLGAM